MDMQKVLVIDDDHDICFLLNKYKIKGITTGGIFFFEKKLLKFIN